MISSADNQKREKAQAMHAQMAGASGLGQIGGMQDPMSALQNSADNQKREKAQAMHAQMAGASGMGQIGGMQDPMNALQNMAMSGSGMPPGQPPGKP